MTYDGGGPGGAELYSEDSPPPVFYEHLGPFRVTSELALPELATQPANGVIPVRIRLGQTPPELPGSRTWGSASVRRGEYLLDIPGTARYYLRDRETVVEIAPGAPPADVRLFLLGSVFGALCLQEGYLPLHASAVARGEDVTVFLGDSGAGKSTLAASLRQRGYRIVSDDICLVEDGGRVIPLAGWVKLWRASLDRLGEAPRQQDRIHSEDDKYRVYLEPAPDAALRIKTLVFLEKPEQSAAQAGSEPHIEELTAIAALGRTMECVYAAYVAEYGGYRPRVFNQCARLLEQARGVRMRMPWGWQHLDGVLDTIERVLL